jgi:rubrerythrin
MTRPNNGRWCWFFCRKCHFNDVRYRNAKKCPLCKAQLRRMRRAKPKEL